MLALMPTPLPAEQIPGKHPIMNPFRSIVVPLAEIGIVEDSSIPVALPSGSFRLELSF